MEHGGNAKVNAIFEAKLPPNSNLKPTNHADGPTRERFIRDKYERRKYYDASASYDQNNDNTNISNGTRSSEESASSVGPPSDAAKQRLEQRRARINKGLSTSAGGGDTTATTTISSSNSKSSRPKIAKAPASAPLPPHNMVDLLGFDTPATAEVSAPTSTTNSKSTTSSTADFDLFDFSSPTGTTSSANNNGASATVNDQWNQLTSQASQLQPPVAAKPSIDLASLYNGVSQQQQQPMGFANFGPSNNNIGYAAANHSNPMMAQHGGGMMMNANNNSSNNNNMQQAMQNMNFSSNAQQHGMMTPQQMAYQQQQMMMMQHQQQQMKLQQQQQMMMQQQHQQFPNTATISNHHHFGSIPNLTPTKVTTTKISATPEKDDPFAQFGTNMFR